MFLLRRTRTPICQLPFLVSPARSVWRVDPFHVLRLLTTRIGTKNKFSALHTSDRSRLTRALLVSSSLLTRSPTLSSVMARSLTSRAISSRTISQYAKRARMFLLTARQGHRVPSRDHQLPESFTRPRPIHDLRPSTSTARRYTRPRSIHRLLRPDGRRPTRRPRCGSHKDRKARTAIFAGVLVRPRAISRPPSLQ